MALEGSSQITIGMTLFPNLTLLDLAGPYEVFSRMPNTRTILSAKTLDPVKSEKGLAVVPDMRLEDAPLLDMLFVPGGPGIGDMMEDEEFISFLKKQGDQAKYVASVCTGSLLLAAAGLLQGYRATTHWLSIDLLKMFGAEAVCERVVIDRNRITGGGVTAGIDFGLIIASMLFGESVAKEIQLTIEYDPEPPFRSGSPKTADADLVERVTAARKSIQEKRREQIERIAKRI